MSSHPPTPASAGLLDGLVERLLAGSPYRFTTAVDEEERAIAYRIRAGAIVEARWAAADAFPEGMETDAFDPAAVHVLGWDGDQPVCTGRLVFPPGPLPTEVACGLVVEPRGQVVDVGRMALVRSHQTFGHGTFLALLWALYREARAEGYSIGCGMMTGPARSVMARLGVQLEELGPSRLHQGQQRAPVRFLLSANVAPLADRWGGPASGRRPQDEAGIDPAEAEGRR
ncbi:MAG: hypothetical protein ACXVX0_08170 [Blastococcus sp.]